MFFIVRGRGFAVDHPPSKSPQMCETPQRDAGRRAMLALTRAMVAQAITLEDAMPTRKTNTFNTDEPSKLQAPTAVNLHGPALLTEAELDHVAAAGGKGGASGGDVRCRH